FTIAATTLFSIASSHVILESPRPFKFAAYGPANPITEDGADFPCKIPPGVTKLEIDGSPTEMAIGETQTASFTGKAVHGGGSCQFSVTEGFEPTKSSVWKVIHSIEGGCPKANEGGNLNDGETPDKYDFTIPDGITPGEWTFAWTWVARIGGDPAEFYMNCAPIVATAGKKAESRESKERIDHVSKRAGFPGLFMTNMGEVSDGCSVADIQKQNKAISFPHPGDSVEHPEGTENLV
ncbi:uncharacterized protein BCR38DRAFT_327089, partial [Pseudomassariella vexata]